MRFEDKAIDGPELQLEQNQQGAELEREDEQEVPEIRVEELLESERENIVLAAMREILERRQVVINDLKLPQRELRALEALKAAVSGKDGELSQFVYATDRRHLLEQALSVLQPRVMHDVTKPFLDLVQRVGSLRHDLKELEDAQDNLLEAHREVGFAKADPNTTDTTDKPKPKPDPDADLSLDGPERTFAKPPTSLTGERKEQPTLPSTLDGPELPPEPEPETTVGSKQDLAEATIVEPQRLRTKPFWKPQ
ncbi:MAG: hypothetical protein ABI591_04740 [Kofleriaceae bacterium]